MAYTTWSETVKLHGSGVANCGSYPEIYVTITMKFTRASASTATVSWEVTDIDWTHPTSGMFGYEFISNISVNGATLSGANEIISKDNIIAENWWNATTLLEPSGSFTNTTNTTTVAFYVEGRHCVNEGTQTPCYDVDGDYLIAEYSVDIPQYVADYDVVYDANGGRNAPASQKKIAGSSHPLTLSSQEPVFPLNITYHDTTDTVISVNRAFQNWQSYFTRNVLVFRNNFVGDGVTTTFPATDIGFDPTADSILSISVEGHAWGIDYTFTNNHITFATAPESGRRIVVRYATKPAYGLPGDIYAPGDTYNIDKNVYMVAIWGDATFTPVTPSTNYYGLLFNYNGGTGTPPGTIVPREILGYATTSGGTKVYDVGVPATTSVDLDLYPLYGNAIYPYSQLPVPTKSGFSFGGWYYDPELTQKITTDIVLTSSITIYAKWVSLPIHVMTLEGEWKGVGPYVWRMVEENGQRVWKKEAHIYQLVEENGQKVWKDLSV